MKVQDFHINVYPRYISLSDINLLGRVKHVGQHEALGCYRWGCSLSHGCLSGSDQRLLGSSIQGRGSGCWNGHASTKENNCFRNSVLLWSIKKMLPSASLAISCNRPVAPKSMPALSVSSVSKRAGFI